MTPVRVAAVRAVMAAGSGHATLAAAIERERRAIPDERDRGLLVELAAGTLRWQAELDAILAASSSRPLDDVDPTVRAILRVATYQLRHLDRIPAHAAIDEAVESTRLLGSARAATFVNAVLRQVQRQSRAPSTLPAPPALTADRAAWVEYLAVTLSHPAWLVARWIDRFGATAAEAWCRFNNASPQIAVRPATGVSLDSLLADLKAHAPEAAASEQSPGAITLPPGALGRLPAELRARLAIQDEGSQLVAHLVDAKPGMPCLDVCAAPGGKTTVVWRDMEAQGLLVAADRRPSRVRLLAATLEGASVPRRVVALDATRPLPFAAAFDRVLVDAPCSGLGTLRRDPDLKWTRHEADLPRLAAVQHTMLTSAADVVRPGGHLIYATCSSEPEENEDVVHQWLAGRTDFRLASPTETQVGGTFVGADGLFRTLPFRDGLDAFFAAVLVRA
jgi:16S rRNA (cytosine967-C5)-methyltransferase